MIGVLFRVLGTVGAGAAAAYFLNPEHGAARRAMFKDKALRLKTEVTDTVQKQVRDLSDRSQNVFNDVKQMTSAPTDAQPQAGAAESANSGAVNGLDDSPKI